MPSCTAWLRSMAAPLSRRAGYDRRGKNLAAARTAAKVARMSPRRYSEVTNRSRAPNGLQGRATPMDAATFPSGFWVLVLALGMVVCQRP
jgi:hypothetical protein